MAHEPTRSVVSEETQRAATQIIVTLVGGVLLLNSILARWIFAHSFYAAMLAATAALFLGIPLVVQAAKDLLYGRTRMNELVALAFLASLAQGTAGHLSGTSDPVGQYQVAAAIAFFMLLSTLIESRTALGARASIESLIRITPTRAFRIGKDGEQEVEARDLRPGDVVRVRPGDNIPGDGIVVNGASTVNQANITGESLPVDKAENDEVFGGTINLTGALEIRITKAGTDTTLGRVQDLILRAEQSRIPLARLVDQYAKWYTPTILMLAGVVLFFTRDLDKAIGILVAACPYALVLATPTAMVAALSAAARLGVLIKNVIDLETARNLTAIVFDKTGTLTTGTLSVTRLGPAPGVDGADLLRTAAQAEQNSRHPVARAVAEVARRARVELGHVTDFEEISGRGVRAMADGTEILVGRATWMEERGISLANLTLDDAEGLSLLYVSRGQRALGWIGLEDKTRPEAAKAMDQLRELGLKQLIMVTGDRASVAKRVAVEMHCTDLRAEVLPAQKLELVDELKQRGHSVCVVGDGVNDAPALAAGNISVAMGAAGSDVAIHSARIALMNDRLNRIPFLIRLSRRTMRVLRQNLGFGILFIVLLELAIILGLPAYLRVSAPLLAALLQMIGSVVVVFNSARLVREGEDLEEPATVEPMRSRTPEPVAA
jgi:Cd2+/Zn2+-exporting ATPase